MINNRMLIGLVLVMILSFGCSEKEDPAATVQKPEPQIATSTTQETGGAQDDRQPTWNDEPVVADQGTVDPVSTVKGNSPPKVLSVSFENPYVVRGVDIKAVTDVVDVDYDDVQLQYRWFINDEELSDLDSPVLAGDRFYKGDMIALWIIPSDQDDEGKVFYGSAFEIPNAPPVFVTSPPLDFRTNSYNYTAQATDPDDDPLTYSLEMAPEGMTIDSKSGQMAWRINAESIGSHQIMIIAQDIEGARAIQEYTLTLSPGE